MAVNESVGVIQEVNEINPLLSKVVFAVLILLLGMILGRILGNIVKRFLNELQVDKHFRSAMHSRLSLEKILANAVTYIIYIITIVLTLNTLGATAAVVTIIVGILIVILAISFLLAVKDFFPNLLAGLRLRLKDAFHEGDEIQIKEVIGKVTHLGLLETRLHTKFNETILIPNLIFNRRQVIIRKKAKGNKAAAKPAKAVKKNVSKKKR